MNTPVPSRSSSPVIVAFVGIAGAVAGSLAVWTALAAGAGPASEHTCACECVTELQTPAAPASEPKKPVAAENTPSPPPTVPRIRQAAAEVEGPVDRDIVRRIVRAHINEVRHCYNQGLKEDPTLAGRVSVEFALSPAGTVDEAELASSALAEDDKGVGDCITKAVKRWKFPKSEGGTTVVTYPFVLTPGD